MFLYTTVQVSGHVFVCAKGIAFVSSCDFSIGFWNYFRQCGIFLLDFELFGQCGILIFAFHFISYYV
jgi:hypothetical protein